MVLPDTLVHLNGHTVITKSYTIFRDPGFAASIRLDRQTRSARVSRVSSYLDQFSVGIFGQDLPAPCVIKEVGFMIDFMNGQQLGYIVFVEHGQ